jgi:hypothetical protein
MYKIISLTLWLLFSYSSNASEYTVDAFKNASLNIALGYKEAKVIEIIGNPSRIESKEWKDVVELNAMKGLVYSHPKWATVHMLVGISKGEVTGVSICRGMGSTTWTTECESPVQYWKGME